MTAGYMPLSLPLPCFIGSFARVADVAGGMGVSMCWGQACGPGRRPCPRLLQCSVPLTTVSQAAPFHSVIPTDTAAIVVHMGSMVGGHYISYVLVDPERVFLAHGEQVDTSGLSALSLSDRPEKGTADRRIWCYCSDTEIRPASETEVLNAKAYMCFVSPRSLRSCRFRLLTRSPVREVALGAHPLRSVIEPNLWKEGSMASQKILNRRSLELSWTKTSTHANVARPHSCMTSVPAPVTTRRSAEGCD